MARWVVKRTLRYVDAELLKGAVVDGVDVKDLDRELRDSFTRAQKRCALDNPNQTMQAIFYSGRARWILVPRDARLHLAAASGVLPRRRVYGDERKRGSK